MKKEKNEIIERTFNYALRIIKLYRELEKDSVGKIIGNQILRSGTGVGANVHEAQGAQSKPDFIAKMSIAHKEAYESDYWIRLIMAAELIPVHKLQNLADETEQIVKMLSSILITSKKRRHQS